MTVPDNHAFDRLVDSFLDRVWKTFPIQATFAGIHLYDHDFDHVSPAALGEHQSFLEATLASLAAFETEPLLDQDRRLDLEVLKGVLKKEIAEFNVYNRYRRDPSHYIYCAVMGCMILLIREYAPRGERIRHLCSRLKEIPRYLKEAQENLRIESAVPSVWNDLAFQLILSGQKFLSQIMMKTSSEAGILKNELLASATLASKAFDEFGRFLEKEINASGDFACGRSHFDFILREFHLLPYDSVELEKMGREYIKLTQDEIKKVASKIDSDENWVETMEKIKKDSPPAEALLEYYRWEVATNRDFVIQKRIATIPDKESLEVVETPPFMRALLPYAAYMRPAPFEPDQKGFFWVTPVDSGVADSIRKQQLSGHSRAAVAIRSLHEGYPGHHLQITRSHQLASKIRRLYGSSVFIEGWALYCEEMMRKEGYLRDRQTHLIQLKDQLWRACRVVIDVGLHCGKMGPDQAAKILTEIAHLEEANARVEIRRYTQNPTQPSSYLAGKIEITKLLEAYKKRHPRATLKETHDRLLSYGSVPVSLAARMMLGTNH